MDALTEHGKYIECRVRVIALEADRALLEAAYSRMSGAVNERDKRIAELLAGLRKADDTIDALEHERARLVDYIEEYAPFLMPVVTGKK